MSTANAGYLLSPQQHRLWQMQQAAPNYSFTTQGILVLEGKPDVATVESALQTVVERFEILRTVYRWVPEQGLPLQVVLETAPPLSLPSVQLAHPLTDADDELRLLLEKARGHFFDLENGPLLHVLLLETPTKLALLCTLPAIAADPLSLSPLAAALQEAISGTPATEPVQYLQYAEYQNEWLGGEESREAREHWTGASAAIKAPAIVGIATTGDLRGFRKKQIEISLSVGVSSLVASFASGRQASPEAAWLAAWTVLLARFAGSNTFHIGVGSGGRTDDELREIVGPFSRTLPMEATVPAGISFAELLVQTEVLLSELRAVEDAYVEGDPGARGAGTAFGFLERPALASGHVLCASPAVGEYAVRLVVQADAEGTPSSGGGVLTLEYDQQRASSVVANRLAQSLAVLVEELLREPERDVYTLPLLSADAEGDALEAWNGTKAAVPTSGPASSPLVLELLERCAVEHPDAIAIRGTDGTLTYRELHTRANQVAHRLRASGVGAESVVGVQMPLSSKAIVAILAVLKSGAAYLPLDPGLPRTRIDFIVQDAGAGIVLSPETWDAWETAAQAERGERLDMEVHPRQAAYVIYTSGSTGTPKGVVVDHAGFAHYMRWCVEAYASRREGQVPLHSSLAFDLSITSLFAPLLAGMALNLAADTTMAALVETVRSGGQFSWIKLTPSHARMLGNALGAENLCDRSRMLVVGGEALYASDLLAWVKGAPSTEIVNEYGPTETVVGCLTYRESAERLRDGAVPIGRPIPGARMYVLDAGLRPAPTGAPGELYIGGASLARGYLRRADQTAERFLPDAFGSPGSRMYRTGDLVRALEDGNLEYLGRLDEQVKIRGYRIELAEIELALGSHPAIVEAAVVPEAGTGRDASLTAYFVVGADSATPSVSALRSFVGSRLPEYMVPSRFVQLAALPVTANGKLDRAQLLRAGGENVQERYKSLPTSLEEEVLASIWANALGRQHIGVDEDYFSLGGDSIRAIQIVGQASQRGLDLSIEMIFRHRTVRDLARAIRSGAESAGRLLAPEPFCMIEAQDRGKLTDAIEDAYPLSALQAGMIFHREFHPESAIYHDIFGYHLRMPLDVEKLEQAARGLVERHPALRTAFHLSGFSEPMQLVHRDAPSPLHVRDLRHLPDDAQVEALHAWMEEEKQRGFDYLQPPLLRFWIHRRTDDSFQFSLSFHHAIIDGWSDANMLMEFAISYQRLLEGKDIGFEAPTTRYREFVALERHALGSAEHRDYWQRELGGSRPLVLPRWTKNAVTDNGRRGVKLQVVPIREDISSALQNLAKARAVPLKSVLLAAHMKVMGVLGGTDDVLSSLSSAGRPETLDGNQVLGLHLNSTPVRVALDNGSWIDLIHRVFEKEREALPYRRYPLAEIQKLVGSRRLSETSFYYTHYHNIQRLTDLPQFEILGRMVYEETSFAMVANFNLDPFSGHLGLTLACDQTEFSEAERQVFGDLYEHALVALAETPEGEYGSLDLLSESMQAQILTLGKGAELEERAGVLPEWIAAAASAADWPALVVGQMSLSYAELLERADRIAAALVLEGVKPGSTVALILPRSIEMVVAVLGVHRAGAAYLPIDTEFPDERQRLILNDARPTATLRLEDVQRGMQGPGPNAEMAVPITVGRTMPAYVIYTSGSMGVPKGTVISHGNLAASTAARLQFYREPVRSYLLLSSFAFDSSVAGIFWTLATGGTLVLPEEGEQRDPVRIHALLREHQVSHVLALPSVYSGVLQLSNEGDLPALERVIVAGEVCPPALVEEHFRRNPEAQFFNEYGPTEATVWTTVARCSASDQSVSIGTTVPGYSTFVLDEAQHLSPIGTAGELYVGGPGVAQGYLNRPELTEERFVPNPWLPEQTGRLYRTGDRVLRSGDGTLHFLGRSDNQVKIRGYRVELEEVESVLREVFRTTSVAVLAREDQPGHSRLLAFVALGAGEISHREEALRQLGERLPDFMIPAHFVYLEELPRTATGKIDRRALAARPIDEPVPANAYVAPRFRTEQTLAEIWQRVLNVGRIGITDDFFALGGDSILSIQIIARAREAGLAIQPRQLFAYRTIEGLVAALSEIDAATTTTERQESQTEGDPAGLVGISETEAEDLLAQLTTDQRGEQ